MTIVTKISKPGTQRRRPSRGSASRRPNGDDSHEDWQAEDPKVTSVTMIGKPGGGANLTTVTMFGKPVVQT